MCINYICIHAGSHAKNAVGSNAAAGAAMNVRSSIVLVLAFAGVAFAAPHPKFTRTDAHARLSTVLAARATSGTECVACEDVLGQVTRQPPPPPSFE